MLNFCRISKEMKVASFRNKKEWGGFLQRYLYNGLECEHIYVTCEFLSKGHYVGRILIISCTKSLKWNTCETPFKCHCDAFTRTSQARSYFTKSRLCRKAMAPGATLHKLLSYSATTEYTNLLVEVSSLKPLILYNSMQRVALKQFYLFLLS